MINPIHRWLATLGMNQAYLGALDRLLGRLDPVLLAVELGLIAGFGLLGWWLAAPVRRLVRQILAAVVPNAWLAAVTPAFDSVSAPLFWLVSMWLCGALSRLFELRFVLVHAMVSLLAAWVTIRLLSFAVRNAALSVVISITAWSVAALSILGLLGPLTVQLDDTAFNLGRIHLSVLTVLRAGLVLALLLWATTLLASYLERQIHRSPSLTPSLQALLVRLVNLVLPVLAILIGLEAVGIDLTALTVLSGAIGIGIGLGLQRSVSNLVAGLTLIMGKTIKPGDVIAYKDTYGWVTSMGARFVAIATRDGSEYLVPNEEFITNGVENWSYTNNLRRLHVPFAVAYESDMHQVIALALEAVRSVERILEAPAPLCLMIGFGESAVNFELRCWINDPRNGITNAKSAVLLALWDIFQANGITIPYPQREVRVKPHPGATMLPLSAGATAP